MFQKFYVLLLLTGFIALNGCASSSGGERCLMVVSKRTVDFCSKPSDLGTALACEAGKRVGKMAFDAAVDAYKSPSRKTTSTSRKTTSNRTNSEKNLLIELSDNEICQGALWSQRWPCFTSICSPNTENSTAWKVILTKICVKQLLKRRS